MLYKNALERENGVQNTYSSSQSNSLLPHRFSKKKLLENVMEVYPFILKAYISVLKACDSIKNS